MSGNDFHGGNIRLYAEKYGLSEKNIIDFSSNINPLGMHPSIKKIIKRNLSSLVSYPDPYYKKLIKSISEEYNINEDFILPGNGSTELIYLLPHVLNLKKALIVEPNFSEYEKALKNNDVEVSYLIGEESENFKNDVEKIISNTGKADIVCISNPNNPSGYLYSREELSELAFFCKKQRVYLFIDEVSWILRKNTAKLKWQVLFRTTNI